MGVVFPVCAFPLTILGKVRLADGYNNRLSRHTSNKAESEYTDARLKPWKTGSRGDYITSRGRAFSISTLVL